MLTVEVTTVVETASGAVHEKQTVQLVADAVICSVPLGVLKQQTISFSPALSAAKQLAIANAGVGNAVKVIMEFATVFWPTSSEFVNLADKQLCSPFLPLDERTVAGKQQQRGLLTSFWNYFMISGKKILVGFALGDGAEMLDKVGVINASTLLIAH